jgi:hypothetical protein
VIDRRQTQTTTDIFFGRHGQRKDCKENGLFIEGIGGLFVYGFGLYREAMQIFVDQVDRRKRSAAVCVSLRLITERKHP